MVKPETEAADSIEFPPEQHDPTPGIRTRQMWRWFMLLVYASFLACVIVYGVVFVFSLVMVNGRG